MVEEKLAQKKEEQEKETKRNNLKIYERNNSNSKVEFMDLFYSITGN